MNPTATEPAGHGVTSADDTAGALQPRDEAGRCGFQIGWDHARHGLVPGADLLVDGTPISQGWLAGKAVFGRRRLPTTPALRGWLRLRTEAWQAGVAFDVITVTPKWLAGIAVSHCPVTRTPLGGAPGTDSAAVTVCLDAAAGYRAGNLAVLSQRAAAAIPGLDLRSSLRDAAAAGDAASASAVLPSSSLAAPSTSSLPPQQAARLAVLLSHCSRLPFCAAARLPLLVLPPPAVQGVNPVQDLQRLLTRQFAAPGWSSRLRALADRLPADASGQPDAALRHDFNLFIGAMAPRLLGACAGADGRLPNSVLEDAWADARVQRRWQQFAGALGEGRCIAFLGSAATQPAARINPSARISAGFRAAARQPATRPGTTTPPPARATRASAHRPAAAR